MTLLQSQKKRLVFAMVIFMFIGNFVYTKTYTLNGRVMDSDNNKAQNTTLKLFMDGNLLKQAETKWQR